MIEKNKELYLFGEKMEKDYNSLKDIAETYEERLLSYEENYERAMGQLEQFDEQSKDMEYTIRKLYKEIDEQTKQFDDMQRQYVILQQQYSSEKENAFGKQNDSVGMDEFNDLKRYAADLEKQFEVAEQ